MLVWQGVPLNLSRRTSRRTTLEGSVQTIAQGPVAALELIKNLGTNGGGFFNANGAHPYENPTPLTNFLEMLAIAVIPAVVPGRSSAAMVGRPRAGWLLLAVMVVLFVAGLVGLRPCRERRSTRGWPTLAVVGGNMEGKETRFGVGGSVLAAVVTSNGATGSYNSMHDSYHPLGVLVLLVNMLLGEVVFGGLGTGLYSLVMIALVAVFLGGLMVGRSPEYLGKTIRAYRGEAGRLLRPDHAAGRSAADGLGRRIDRGPGGPGHQRRRPRLHGDPLRLRLVHGQQRPEHGGAECQQRLLQPHDHPGHDGRAIRASPPWRWNWRAVSPARAARRKPSARCPAIPSLLESWCWERSCSSVLYPFSLFSPWGQSRNT